MPHIVVESFQPVALPVQSVPITIKVASSNPVHGEVYSIQYYVIKKFVSDLWQVSGFLRILRFRPPIKTYRHDITEILLKVALNNINLNTILDFYIITVSEELRWQGQDSRSTIQSHHRTHRKTRIIKRFPIWLQEVTINWNPANTFHPRPSYKSRRRRPDGLYSPGLFQGLRQGATQ